MNWSESLKSYYVEVESQGIDYEFLDSWEFIKIEKDEVESAIRLIRRINFGDERVDYLDNGVELYIRRSPKIRMIEESIDALNRATFYSELHQEESCVYSVLNICIENIHCKLTRYCFYEFPKFIFKCHVITSLL